MTEWVEIGRKPPKGWTAIYCFAEHDGEVRYVGKTSNYMIDRRKQHLLPSNLKKRRPINFWLKKRRGGVGFVTRLIEHVRPGEDWAARERYWIARYRADGHRLLNMTDGGEGTPGCEFSAERRKKMSAAAKTGKTFSCLCCGSRFYRKKSEIAKGQNKYCSRTCYQKHGNRRPKTVSNETIQAGRLATKARHAAQTHCKRGHPLSGGNLFTTSSGSRGCKECRKIHKRNYLERKRNG